MQEKQKQPNNSKTYTLKMHCHARIAHLLPGSVTWMWVLIDRTTAQKMHLAEISPPLAPLSGVGILRGYANKILCKQHHCSFCKLPANVDAVLVMVVVQIREKKHQFCPVVRLWQLHPNFRDRHSHWHGEYKQGIMVMVWWRWWLWLCLQH